MDSQSKPLCQMTGSLNSVLTMILCIALYQPKIFVVLFLILTYEFPPSISNAKTHTPNNRHLWMRIYVRYKNL